VSWGAADIPDQHGRTAVLTGANGGTSEKRKAVVVGVTVLRNASVLDAERAALAEGQSVVVEGGRIADVGPGLSVPHDAVVIDVAGKTLMPGLIDAHTHPMSVSMEFAASEWSPTYVAARAGRALEGMLARGFTSIRDVGRGEHGLAQAVEEGYFTGPRIFYGGKQLTQTGGAGDYRAPSRRVYEDNYYAPTIGVICDGVAEVRRAVREEVRRGAHHIKVYLSGAVDAPSDRVDSTQFSIEELHAIVEEATAANIYVAGHAYTSRAINRGLECGVRSIEHGNLMDASSIPLFLQYGAFYVPTIVTYHTLAQKSRDGLLPADIDAKLHTVIGGAIGALEMTHKAGIPIVYGTDLFADMHGQQLQEFIIRSEVQPTADLIRSATTTAARLLHREGELGVVAPGAYADLLVIDGNPLDDIRVLTTPDQTLKLIMKEGVIYKNEL
jgi:imidazolonepropionase-like amidohydrolase